MSDVYRSVSHRSLGDNLLESLKSFLVGLLLFLVSFPLLWWNEGRTDLSLVAKQAIVVPASGGPAGEGKLVSITGDLRVDDKVGDPELLQPGAYVKLARDVEMWAWIETTKTHTEKQLGGGSKKVTTVTYDLGWTRDPKSPDRFEHPEGHQNPPLPIHAETFYAPRAFVGAFSFVPTDAELPPPRRLTPAPELLRPGATAAPAAPPGPSIGASARPPRSPKPPARPVKPVASEAPAPQPPPAPPLRTSGDYVLRGSGSLEQPALGDVRISFNVVEPTPGPVTLYGTRQGTTVVPYLYEGSDKLFRVVPGTHEQAIAMLHSEHVTMTWVLRIVGAVLMWLGLTMTVAPINAALDIVPLIGAAGRFLTGVVMLPIAFVLSAVTIVLSILAHNPILLLVPIAGLIGLFVLVGIVRSRRGSR